MNILRKLITFIKSLFSRKNTSTLRYDYRRNSFIAHSAAQAALTQRYREGLMTPEEYSRQMRNADIFYINDI